MFGYFDWVQGRSAFSADTSANDLVPPWRSGVRRDHLARGARAHDTATGSYRTLTCFPVTSGHHYTIRFRKMQYDRLSKVAKFTEKFL